MRADRFEIDADRFESFQGSQPVRSLRCDFLVWESRRHSRAASELQWYENVTGGERR